MPKRFNNNSIMVWSDPHAPYHHKDTLSFLKNVRDQFAPDRVICGGDLGDTYNVSSYPKDIDHPDSWSQEIKGLRKFVKEVSDIFPELTVLSSNHDDRIYRRAVISGIPRESIIPYEKLIGAPDTWKWVPYLDLTVDHDRSNWHFAHTITGGSLNAAKQKACSVCVGHLHTEFGAKAFNSGKKIVYGVDAGCLISDKGSPFKYNKISAGRPIRGCVMIVNGTPQLIRM